MPKEIHLEDINEKLIERTLAVYKRKAGDHIKYKLRTKKTLYTIKVPASETDAVEKAITSSGKNVEIISE